jgi:hypothetical protein
VRRALLGVLIALVAGCSTGGDATPVDPTPGTPPTVYDVGAPFDTCSVIGWADFFPEQVRPDNPRKPPSLMEVDPDDGFSTGCRFDNSAAGKTFLVDVVWGDDEWAELDPPNPGTKQLTIRGRPGQVIEDQGTNGEQRCFIKFALERGAGAVVLSDSRFRIDTCASARLLATVIAERTFTSPKPSR